MSNPRKFRCEEVGLIRRAGYDKGETVLLQYSRQCIRAAGHKRGHNFSNAPVKNIRNPYPTWYEAKDVE